MQAVSDYMFAVEPEEDYTGFLVYVYILPSGKDLAEEHKKHFPRRTPHDDVMAFTDRFNDGCLIFLSKDDLDVWTIVHESHHAATLFASYAGIKPDKAMAWQTKDAERYTQVVENIAFQIMEEVNKYNAILSKQQSEKKRRAKVKTGRGDRKTAGKGSKAKVNARSVGPEARKNSRKIC